MSKSEILRILEDYEIRLTSWGVREVAEEVRKQDLGCKFGEAEFFNSVFEAFVQKFHLPLTFVDGFKMPDFKDPQIIQLRSELEKFEEVINEVRDTHLSP